MKARKRNSFEVNEVTSEYLKKHFEETPQKELDKEWKEIEPLNDIGPNVLEYIDKIKNQIIMESYEKKYKDLEGKIKKAYLYAQTDSTKAVLEDILPELAESEDEKVRKSLIKGFNECLDSSSHYPKNAVKYWHGIVIDDILAWFEKQKSVEEIVERCKNSWYNEGKIAGMAEGLSDDEKYQQGWHDALEAIKEKADNANKVEPKFHEGDWVVTSYGKVNQVIAVDKDGDGYTLDDGVYFSGSWCDMYHLWTIKDAKDGDVLVSDNIVFIFNKIHDIWIKCHCSLYEDDSFYGGDFNLMHIKYGKEVFPATKDQCDTIERAITNAGYRWDKENLNLEKI